MSALQSTPSFSPRDSRRKRITSAIMASPHPLSESQATFPSDSENYDANHSNQDSSSDEQPSSSSSPLILYSPPTIWSVLRGAAINLVLPFLNGICLGLGELCAHEAAYRLGWSGTKVSLHTLRKGRGIGCCGVVGQRSVSRH